MFDYVIVWVVVWLNVLSELCLFLVKKEGYFLVLKVLKSEEEINEVKFVIVILGG